ncbi:hypothetical protein LTS16_016530 [Friedmanniomyces endolithicus]|uniref:Uncharacterized protein n=1 Tax=Friedmanniomyces endolithicus TaxID=329885 RepID=A0AAN6G5H5_9PEZI|nr:hypothetical protein LTS00_014386 [Friedmanniomyces endolithicus]KAK0328111.1 hypothetical protein LTR82_000038 [Friedmanniomyces endolithicus]KAK0823729.1 hypothetical protein LTR73_008309 [Friedmanniomyces endolithicus]KAK1033194.1 hypothetical protein LTS16_016530 [Friedmanniomyces endolithicus]
MAGEWMIEPCLGEESTVSVLDTPSVQDEGPLDDWHDNTAPHGEETYLSDDVTFDSFMESTSYSQDDPVLGGSSGYEGSSNLDNDPPFNAIGATPAARQSLIETVQRGLVPSTTVSTGLLCGIYALVGSLNAAFPHQGTPLRVERVMRTMFLNYDLPDQAPRLTPEYEAFLRLHMENNVHLTAGEDGYEEIWEALTAPNNFGADQLAVLLRFLHLQGMVDREFDVGVLAAENGHRGVLATAHIGGNGGAGAPLIWLYNDNAMRLVGATYNHWSMFAETADPSNSWLRFVSLVSQDNNDYRTSPENLPAEHVASPGSFPHAMDDFAFSKDYILPSFNNLESIREPGEYSGESVTSYAGHADSAQLSGRVLSPLLEGADMDLVNPVYGEFVGLTAAPEPELSNDTNNMSQIEDPNLRWLSDDFDDTLSSGVSFWDYIASSETDTSSPAD